MQYRAFDSLTHDFNNYTSIFYELVSCHKIYYGSQYDVTYLIFNKAFNKYKHNSNLSRIDLICEVGRFPHELFCNIPFKIDLLGAHISFCQDDPVITSAPVDIANHSHYMMFFSLANISLFPDEAATHFLYRLDML